MPIPTPTVLAHGNGSGGIAHTTSFTPGADKLILVMFGGLNGNEVEVPVIGGTATGITWTYQGWAYEYSTGKNLHCWTGLTSSSPGAGDLTFTRVSGTGKTWYAIMQFGPEVDYADPIVQLRGRFVNIPPENGNEAALNAHQEMAPFRSSEDGMVQFTIFGNTDGTLTDPPGWTRLGIAATQGVYLGAITEWRPNEQLLITGPSWTTPAHYIAFCAEMRKAGVTGGRVRERALGSNTQAQCASANDLTAYTTLGFTPYADTDLWFAITSSRTGATPSQPTITNSGTPLSWSLVESQGYNSLATPLQKLWLFHARVGSGASTTITVTATYPETQTSAAWQIVETKNSHATLALVQTAKTAANATAAVAVPFAANPESTSSTIVFVAKAASDVVSSVEQLTATPESGWVPLDQSTATPVSISASSFARNTPDASPTLTLRAAADYAAIAIEVRDANVTPGPPPPGNSTDDYGIDYTGATDVTAALAAAINEQPPGATFTFHPGGKFLTGGIQENVWTPTDVTIDGLGATLFRNVRRNLDTATGVNDLNIIEFNAPGSTLKNLNVYGFRKDVYTGDLLTTVAGTPTVSGTTMLLDAQNEEVRLPNVKLDFLTPPGNFTNDEIPYYSRYGLDGLLHFEALLSDTNHVTGDCVFSLIDDSNNAVLVSSTLTLTSTPTSHEITFNPAPAHLATRMRVHVKKATSTPNQIVVGSITPWGEAGYRRRGLPPPYTYTGGNEFSDGIFVSAADVDDVTFDNVWVEGTDGDGFNLTLVGTNCHLIDCTSRTYGRMGFTIEDSEDTTFLRCLAREGGRAGWDFEPIPANPDNDGTILTDCTAMNIRNYAISASPWPRNLNITIDNFVSADCGMGACFGGGIGVTINGWHHTGTYRTDADRIANGGTAGIDMIFFGLNITGDDISTQIGIQLKDVARLVPPVTGVSTHPDNINLTNCVALTPTLNPGYIIDPLVTNSSVEMSGTPLVDAVWDSTTDVWDSTTVLWDGGAAVGPPQPAFQGSAFQTDAFQVSGVGSLIDIIQTMPAFTQTVSAFSGYAMRIAQTLGALEQAAQISVGGANQIAQELGGLTQALEETSTVHGRMGFVQQIFQADAFQSDAFDVSPNLPVNMPAFTQMAIGGVQPHLTVFTSIVQRLGALTQTLVTTNIERSVQIAQELGSFTQSLAAEIRPGGFIVQTMPSFTQEMVGRSPVGGAITQEMPAFVQLIVEESNRWPEWPETPGSEWPVGNDEEWLVRHH